MPHTIRAPSPPSLPLPPSAVPPTTRPPPMRAPAALAAAALAAALALALAPARAAAQATGAAQLWGNQYQGDVRVGRARWRGGRGGAAARQCARARARGLLPPRRAPGARPAASSRWRATARPAARAQTGRGGGGRRRGGGLVAKVLGGGVAGMLCARLGAFFADVSLAKPRASRAASVEAFVVCRGFSLPAGAEDAGERLWGVLAGGAASGAAGEAADAAAAASGGGATTTTTTDDAHAPASRLPPPTPQARRLVPFVACGDLSGWDADMGYDLDGFDDSKKLGPDNAEGTASKPALLSPVAPPTEPAYAGALRREGRW